MVVIAVGVLALAAWVLLSREPRDGLSVPVDNSSSTTAALDSAQDDAAATTQYQAALSEYLGWHESLVRVRNLDRDLHRRLPTYDPRMYRALKDHPDLKVLSESEARERRLTYIPEVQASLQGVLDLVRAMPQPPEASMAKAQWQYESSLQDWLSILPSVIYADPSSTDINGQWNEMADSEASAWGQWARELDRFR